MGKLERGQDGKLSKVALTGYLIAVFILVPGSVFVCNRLDNALTWVVNYDFAYKKGANHHIHIEHLVDSTPNVSAGQIALFWVLVP